jgi:hypothetical protein
MATIGATPAPSAWSCATSLRTCVADWTFRLKSTMPPGVYSSRNARVSGSSVGPGRPTMKTWATDRRRTAVGIGRS